MKKITIKSSVIALALTATAGFGGNASAGIFDQLASVANSALPAYGRDYMANTRPDLTEQEIATGIKQAMELGSDRVAETVTEEGGYLGADLRLSSGLRKAKKLALKLGYEQQFEEFEQQLNQATVAVAPITRDLLHTALLKVEITEPRKLLVAHDTAATNFLYTRLQTILQSQLQEVAEDSLKRSGAASSGEMIAAEIKFDDLLERLMIEHVVEQNLKGFFLQLAAQEQKIRLYPEYRSTPLLRDVFG